MYLRFKQKNFKTWIQEVALLMGVKVKNYFLVLPELTADGFCYADSVDRSFSYVLMNANLKENCTIHRISNNQMGLVIFFNQIKVSDHFGIKSKHEEIKDYEIKDRNNIFVSSSNTELEMLYTAGTNIKRLGIYLTPQWIAEHFDANTKLQLELLIGKALKQVNKIQINQEVKEKLNLIFETNLMNDAEKLILKSRVILLLEYFFSTFLNDSLEIRNKKLIPDDDINKLKNIEKILIARDTDKFPSITMLARLAHMSGTKLKQRFKQVYGYRLYEYYNKQRLHKAKEMMEEGMSPKEAGYAIGFNDVSNFTKAFKKEYGHTPRKVLEK